MSGSAPAAAPLIAAAPATREAAAPREEAESPPKGVSWIVKGVLLAVIAGAIVIMGLIFFGRWGDEDASRGPMMKETTTDLGKIRSAAGGPAHGGGSRSDDHLEGGD